MGKKAKKSPGSLLITGAARRIGAAIAEHCAGLGWNLVLHYHRSKGEAAALAKRLRDEHGVTVTCKQADLRDSTALADFWNGLPKVNAMVYSAAQFERDTLSSMHEAALQVQLQVNFIAPLMLAQGFMKQLPKDTHGSITILGDGVMGWSISPEFFSYAASKQAWLGVLDLLAAATAPRARANLLALALTLPGMLDTKEMFDRLASRAPLKRTGTVEDVCDAVEYLLGAQGVTGQLISLAGGAQLQTHRFQA